MVDIEGRSSRRRKWVLSKRKVGAVEVRWMWSKQKVDVLGEEGV